MKQKNLNTMIVRLRICVIAFIFAIASLLLFSFTSNEDFFKQLGIDKIEANQKISSSLLGGYLNAYGLKNLKNIALGNRSAVAKDLLVYTHDYTGSPAFKQVYQTLRQNNKPVPLKIQTPEEMRKDMIDSYRKSIYEMEEACRLADAKTKKIFQDVVNDTKKQLAETEDVKNPIIANYAKNYDQLVESGKQSYLQQIAEWETLFPENGQLFVRKRLIKFLDETKDIDFNAELIIRNGKKIFVNPAYERKSNNWKMGFRAGKEVVQPARIYVNQWIEEIK